MSFLLRATALALALSLAPSALAGGTLYRAYVDPVNGFDPGAIDDPNLPFRTLNAAISALSFTVGGGDHGLVVAGPGIYSAATNQENLPVIMADQVSVQGVGARRCVIRGDGSITPFNVFWPTPPMGQRQPREILVDFSFVEDMENESMLDGFTFQGGDVQVYVESEFTMKRGRISNCIFDLVEGGEFDLYGPSFGLLTVQPYCPETSQYFDIKLNVLNNTFIQGWDPDNPNVPSQWGNELVARAENVGICDVNDPSSDPQSPPLRGQSNLNIQNNVIRSIALATRTAMLGVGRVDTTPAGGFLGSNSFSCPLANPNPGECGGFGGHVNPQFASAVLGSGPIPAVETLPFLGGSDPDFIGEMLNFKYAPTNFGGNLAAYIDWRILPSSSLVDRGTAPNSSGTLAAQNGTAYQEDPTFPELSSFDWDGEGYGNPRIAGAAPDIGFDEAGAYIAAGSYGNASNSHNLPWDPSIAQGQATRYMITPEFGIAVWYLSLPQVQLGVGWSQPPGTQDVPILVPDQPPVILTPPFNFQYLDPSPAAPFMQINLTVPTAQYTNPKDGTTHTLGVLKFALSEVASLIHLNQQLLLLTDSGDLYLSNLQTEYF